MTHLSLTPTLARRLAITRQRLAGPQPAATSAGIMSVLRDLGCLQIDPIRAVERTQYLVLWSRLGAYDPARLDALLWEERRLFEYFAHAASIVLTENYPLHHFQMRNFSPGQTKWGRRVRAWLADNEPFRRYVLEELRHRGPLSSQEIEDRSITPWQSTGWTDNRNVGRMLDFLWAQGEITVAARRGLQRKWALAKHHFPTWTPRDILSAQEVSRRAAQISLRALGVATARQIKNHFIRDGYPDLEATLADLTAEKRILPAVIETGGATWPDQWYIHAEDAPLLAALAEGSAWQPRTTLLSPFDNLICDRDRTERLWDFHFRLEIYTPQAKRRYGYYVLPILHGDRLIGRIDPKMDRKSGVFHINALYAEPDSAPDQAAGRAVIQAIEELARFLEAKEIRYEKQFPQEWT